MVAGGWSLVVAVTTLIDERAAPGQCDTPFEGSLTRGAGTQCDGMMRRGRGRRPYLFSSHVSQDWHMPVLPYVLRSRALAREDRRVRRVSTFDPFPDARQRVRRSRARPQDQARRFDRATSCRLDAGHRRRSVADESAARFGSSQRATRSILTRATREIGAAGGRIRRASRRVGPAVRDVLQPH